jgi:hypothetical protein
MENKRGDLDLGKAFLILFGIVFFLSFVSAIIKNNDTSGKITLPKNLINKKVFIVWFDDEKEV